MSVARERTQPDERTSSTVPDQDVVFEILKNERRRQLIRVLTDSETGASDISDLSERLAAWENDVPLEDVSYKQRKRVYISLHQTHLPKLDEASVVEYDRRSGSVRLTDVVAVYNSYLDMNPAPADDSSDWEPDSGVLAGLGVVTVFTLLVAGFRLSPFGVLPLEALVAALFTIVLTAVYVHQSRPE